ncbi:MAG: hypothetical protein ACHQ2Y_07310 [Candidatus Lutacidiplasmatales archaeon]
MKKIKQHYPRRREMLNTPFEPLTDEAFRQLVKSGSAIPCQDSGALFVSKWRVGPGLDPEIFLAALRAQGSTLVARRFKADVNIRVVRPAKTAAGNRRP